MNSQLQQLESSVADLVAQFKNLLDEKNLLAAEVGRLREQHQRLSQEFQAEKAALTQKHELQVFQLEQRLQQDIDTLREENQRYQQVLHRSVQDLQAVLQRLPVNDVRPDTPNGEAH